ncbi:MAG: hypothetical protein SFX72_16665 [Isosphaeraceae bacterium]|nr:hypothetical protein [Isosphaeraceae bacterium]
MSISTFLILGIGSAVLSCLSATPPRDDRAEERMHGGLEILRPGLPDGQTWLLGEAGVGRPFLARILIVNRSQASIVLWDHETTEGSLCAAVELTDAAGRTRLLKPPVIERTGSGPARIAIAPNAIHRLELELLRASGIRELEPGDYELRVVYLNRNAGTSAPPVWTGRLVSEAVAIRIVPPGRP